jgi:hypothetical protein
MPDDIKAVSLYDQDFSAWALAQADALRAARDIVVPARPRRGDLPAVLRTLDWDNLAEEIEGLARKDRRELASRITTIIEHLLKLQHSAAPDPRAGWMEAIGHARSEIEDILRDSPSLRRVVDEVISDKGDRAVRLAAKSLVEHGELSEAAAARLSKHFSADQVIGDWWPTGNAA